MDVYRALNVDTPHLLFSCLHQARPGVSAAGYAQKAVTLHNEIRTQFQSMHASLEQWEHRQYAEQAEESMYKLQRLGAWTDLPDPRQAQRLLERENQRLGDRIGSASFFGLQGSGEALFSAHIPTDPNLAGRVTGGLAYLASLGFTPERGVIHESWFLMQGSIHYDILEQLLRQRAQAVDSAPVAHASVSTYKLVYQLGESLATPLDSASAIQEVMLAFTHQSWPYSFVIQAVPGLMEDIAERTQILHASFWQPRLDLDMRKTKLLRIRLASGGEALRSLLDAISAAAREGEGVSALAGTWLLSQRIV